MLFYTSKTSSIIKLNKVQQISNDIKLQSSHTTTPCHTHTLAFTHIHTQILTYTDVLTETILRNQVHDSLWSHAWFNKHNVQSFLIQNFYIATEFSHTLASYIMGHPNV